MFHLEPFGFNVAENVFTEKLLLICNLKAKGIKIRSALLRIKPTIHLYKNRHRRYETIKMQAITINITTQINNSTNKL